MRWVPFSSAGYSTQNIKILKIVSIVAPAVFIAVFEILRHNFFVEHQPMVLGNVSIIVIVLAACFLLYNSIFGFIEKLRSESLRRNQELTVLNDVALTVNESLDLDTVLNRTLDGVLRIAGAQAGEIIVFAEQSQDIVKHIH